MLSMGARRSGRAASSSRTSPTTGSAPAPARSAPVGSRGGCCSRDWRCRFRAASSTCSSRTFRRGGPSSSPLGRLRGECRGRVPWHRLPVRNRAPLYDTSRPLLNLNARLTHRALRLHLTVFMRRYRDALDKDAGASMPALPEAEPYQALHPWIAATFNQRIVQLGLSQAWYSSMIVCFVVYIALFIATGSCIPLAFFTTLILNIILLVVELGLVATGNTQVSTAADLYLQARREARELTAAATIRAACDPDPDRSAHAAKLSAALVRHADVLGSFAGIGERRVRFLGFPVSFGTVRTLCITGFTVGFGLWSILRGAGVFLTVESACPNV